MVAARMTGLIAGGEGVVDVPFDSEGLPADGVDDGMAVAAQLRILEFEALDELQSSFRRLCFQHLAENLIQASSAVGSGKAKFQRLDGS